ncbi:putative GAG-pre-integrase domain-containing protein [Helianthus anomalus]
MQELTAENLGKMVDKVLAAKALEVDSNSVSESKSQCKFCKTVTYLNGKKVDDLTTKVRNVDNQILDRDKMVKASTERLKELTNKIESDKIDHERVKKENEKLILENRQISEKFEKLKSTMKDNDDRNGKTYKENVQLKAVLRVKEESINQQLDEIAKLKLKFQEAEIENERIQLKLNSYSSASFVLQHIVPKPIGKNKAGEDVYSDGTGVGFHRVPPPILDNYTKKQSGLVEIEEENEVKLPESIDVTFTSSNDDSVQNDIVKGVVENVLKTESDTTEEDGCFLDKYIPKQKSKNNLNEESNLVMYNMLDSDKLLSDSEFLIENVNMNKLTNVFKLVEVELSEVNELSQTKRKMSFVKDKSYYKKPVNPPRFYNNNRNNWSGGYQGAKSYQKRNVPNKRFVEKKKFVNSSSSLADEEKDIFSKSNKEFFEKRASQVQSEGTSRVCTNAKPKTETVKTQQKKADVKGKAPIVVEKKSVKNDNIKVKNEPVKKLVTKNDKFYKRVALSQQVWKPKTEKKVSPSEDSIPIDYDANFPPLKAENFKIQNARVKSVKVTPKSDEARDLPKLVSRWIMDSGASRHMTGKTTLMYDVRNINGGYVGFAGNQGGRIVGEGTLSNGIVTFERVNYIAELENNLLSVSQICDRMYTTLFTDKECLILKPGFVIPEEWIIIRAPRVNDLYLLDMSVATTTTGQAHCFVSRATEKESRLWHRKMGHIHLRKMNHLVHNDLVL